MADNALQTVLMTSALLTTTLGNADAGNGPRPRLPINRCGHQEMAGPDSHHRGAGPFCLVTDSALGDVSKATLGHGLRRVVADGGTSRNMLEIADLTSVASRHRCLTNQLDETHPAAREAMGGSQAILGAAMDRVVAFLSHPHTSCLVEV